MNETTTIYFGLNTISDEKIKEFTETVNNEGAAKASWSVTGRTKHQMLAQELANKLPQFKFEIDYDSYSCIATKVV